MDQEKLNNLAGVKLFVKGQESTMNSTNIMLLTLEFEPMPCWWETSALTPVPFLPDCVHFYGGLMSLFFKQI